MKIQSQLTQMGITIYTCKKCGHNWISRLNTTPVQCPKCHRTDYNRDKIERGDK